jgi:DNA-binding ferritin-like protein
MPILEDTVDTEKQSTNSQNDTPFEEKKPVIDQMTDLAAEAVGALAETAVKTVAKKAKKAVARRIPKSVKKAAKTVANAAAKKKTAKKTAKKFFTAYRETR